MAGRKRTGTLVWTGASFSARVAGGPLTPLYTDDRALALVRLRELVRGAEPPTPTGGVTFREAALQVCEAQRKQGMVTVDERLSRLERYVFPELGGQVVTAIKSSQISAVLASALAAAGRDGSKASRSFIGHLHTDIHIVFAKLVKDEILETNPARAEKVEIPRGRKDRRKRVLLTDAEFERFIRYHLQLGGGGAPVLPAVRRRPYPRPSRQTVTRRQLAIMALVSRCFGGLRPSDIHAWMWEDIDLLGWQWADAPRPKTEYADDEDDGPPERQRLELAPIVVAILRAWWTDAGRPTTGLVFPAQKHSYARDLRRALLEAGIDRPELHEDGTRTRQTDFYSFRRAFNTALARANVNAQTAMLAAGHKSMATHMRYVVPEVVAMPSSALPELALGSAYEPPATVPPLGPVSPAPATPDPDAFEAALERFECDTPGA